MDLGSQMHNNFQAFIERWFISNVRFRWPFLLSILALFIVSLIFAPNASAVLRTADSVTENFTPARTINFACSTDVSVVSNGDIGRFDGYCPSGNQTTYEITFNFNSPGPNEVFDNIVIWANAGNIYNDNELRIFDLEVDYIDVAGSGATTTLVMNDVTLGDTLNDNDPQTVTFENSSGTAIVLNGISEIRMSNLRNNLGNAGEAPFRELQVNVRPVDLDVVKTSQIFDPDSLGLFSLPGNDVTYTIRVSNLATSPDGDSVELIDLLPAELEFFNGDADGSGPGVNPINFIESNSDLTFNFATDAAFSDAITVPDNFGDCTYTPSPGYDPNIRFICLRPQGVFRAIDPAPFIEFTFRARIK